MGNLNQGERFFGKFKQGQTIYQAALEVDSDGEWEAVLVKYFLHSHKTQLPKSHQIIVAMNESYVNWQADAWCDELKPRITKSRRKAERILKELKKDIFNGVYG